MKTSTLMWVIIAVAFSTARFAFAANWPGFGGANSNFSIEYESGNFDAAPSVLWSRELGFGNSGIVEYDGVLFTTYRDLDPTGSISDSETVIAVDGETGDTIWSFAYFEPPIEGQNDYGGGRGPHATPYVTQDYLFTLGYAGSFHCLDRETGKLIWKLNLVEHFEAEAIQFGFSSSPIVLDERLIIQASGAQGGLFALEPGTGRTQWKSPSVGASYATPVLMEIGGERQLVFLSQNLVQGIRLTDGVVRWEFRLPKAGLTNVPTPLLLGNGRIFIAGQGVGGAAVIQVSEVDDVFRVEEIWNNTRVNFFHNSFIAQNGFVFGGSSFLYGLSAENGKRAWTERGYELANVIGLGELAVLAPKDGRIILAKLNAEGAEELHSIEVFETEAWAPPTILEDRIYARDREALVALSLSGERGNVGSQKFLAAKKELIRVAEIGNQLAIAQLFNEWNKMDRPPMSRDAQLRTVQAIADAENTVGAKALLVAMIENDPNLVIAYSKLGRLLLVEGEQEEALKAYRAAVAIDPNFEEGVRILGQLGDDADDVGNVRFKISRIRGAKLVTVAGSFNNWDPFHTFLRREGSSWETAVELPPGEHEYKFVVDGNWMLDPKNPNRKGDGNNNVNSLLIVE